MQLAFNRCDPLKVVGAGPVGAQKFHLGGGCPDHPIVFTMDVADTAPNPGEALGDWLDRLGTTFQDEMKAFVNESKTHNG